MPCAFTKLLWIPGVNGSRSTEAMFIVPTFAKSFVHTLKETGLSSFVFATSLFATGAPSLSKIVTTPNPSRIDALMGFCKLTLKYSVDSNVKLSTIGMSMFLLVSPAKNVRVPVVEV